MELVTADGVSCVLIWVTEYELGLFSARHNMKGNALKSEGLIRLYTFQIVHSSEI
jgi:hypothetical protein